MIVDLSMNITDLIFQCKVFKSTLQMFHSGIIFIKNQNDIQNYIDHSYESFQKCLYLMNEGELYYYKILIQNEKWSEK